MAILLTGAAGFIGMHVAQALLARGESVIGVDNINDYYEVVFAEMIAERALCLEAVSFDTGRWYEIDTIEDLCNAEQLFDEDSPTQQAYAPRKRL